jgi:3D (Asp-Asp-Asp) domain-containing protein
MNIAKGGKWMRNIAMVVLTVVALNILTPFVPTASAATPADLLASYVSQNSNTAQIQDLLKVKQALEQGDQNAVLGILAKTIIAKTGSAGILPAATGSTDQTVETALRGQIVQAVGDRLAPYQQKLDLLASLLGGANVLNPQAARDNNSLTGAPQNYQRIVDMTATAYGPGYPDNGPWGNQTYMGGTVHKGVAAVDPRVIPMGSKLWIPGYGFATAEDQGSAIQGNRIDLAFDNRQAALDYGIQNQEIYVLN